VIDDLDAVRTMLPDGQIVLVETLPGGDSAQVQRIRVRQPGLVDRTVIVKRFKESEGWAREVAGLASARGPVPALLAASAAPPVIICEDLGRGPSVADALLAPERETAVSAIMAWATSMARLHVASLPQRDIFRDALSAKASGLPIDNMPLLISQSVSELGQACAPLDIVVPPTAREELHGLSRQLGSKNNAALSPADACPDNNIRRGSEVVLIDFEDAQWRHIAWDIAYLTVPWPSCWCSWRLPTDVVNEAVARYRDLVSPALPYVSTSAFDRDLQAATIGWIFVSVAKSLQPALTHHAAHDDPRLVAPTRRARILHRLAVAADTPELPTLSALACRLRDALVDRWGELPLKLAPAFRTANRSMAAKNLKRPENRIEP
jgi:hypothetical protein